jgi:hypothetical protein
MKEIEIINHVVRGEMPDLEQVRQNCHNKAANEISLNGSTQKRHQLFTLPKMKIIATALAVVLVVGLFNVQAITAFIGELFFVPGVGLTVNPNLISAVLDEPVLIEANGIEYRLEFATKVKRETGECEIMFFFTTEYIFQSSDVIITPAVAIINGKEHKLKIDNIRTKITANGEGGNGTYSISEINGNYSTIVMYKYKFPDVNEFELRLYNTTVNINLSELADEEKIPNLSGEINGITLAAYKYRNNNNVFGYDVINKNTENPKFNTYDSSFLCAYDIDGNILNRGRQSNGLDVPAKTKDGLGYRVECFVNEENVNIDKVSTSSINVTYHFDKEKSWMSVPVPKDGETLYPDVKIPIADGIIYELTSIRREGDTLYIEDNGGARFAPNNDVLQEAVKNNEIGITALFTAGFHTIEGTITDFDPSDLRIQGFYLTYYGDFAVSFD